MRIAVMRAILSLVAVGELTWSLTFYLRPDVALGVLGRGVLDPVIARQYPLYLISAAIAYALAATDPVRYRGIVLVCVAQRAVELVVALTDWRAHAISSSSLLGLAALEVAAALALVLAAGKAGARQERPPVTEERDRGLIRLLRGFGGLELFWFFASTIFVQVGSRLLHWKLQDAYTTQQQGIALLVIGLVSLLTASDVSRYRVFVCVPIGSQLIGVANSFNEIRLGSIGWSAAAIQWTIELSIAAAFVYYSRSRLALVKPATSLDPR